MYVAKCQGEPHCERIRMGRECVLDITIVIVANICKQFAVDGYIRGGQLSGW